MPDRDPAALFGAGLDETTQPYMDDSITSTAADDNRSFYPDGSTWNFQDTDNYDNTSSIFPQSWEVPQGPQDQQQQLQLQQQQQYTQPPKLDQLASISPATLYTDPLSDQPSSAVQTTPGGLSQHQPNVPTTILNTLTPAQKERLKKIAMPAHLQYHSPKSEASPESSGGDHKGGSMSSPEPADSRGGPSRKRKSSADVDDDDDDDDLENQPVKKTAHNMIEKRYRTNLNDKIAALRDSVPSLRIMSKSARGEDTTEDREELHGLTPAHKLNKATVLSKATEYIRHLEKRNSRLQDENNNMQARISAFEKLFMAGAMNGAMSPIGNQSPSPLQYPQDAAFMTPPIGTPRGQEPAGMIQVPEDMRKILSAQMASGRPYPVPQQQQQQQFQPNPALMRQQHIQQQQQQAQQQNRWQNAGPYFGKLMVGSLAGLMVLEVVREEEQSNETTEGRGLLAMPVHLLGSLASGTHFSIAGYSYSLATAITSLKFLVLLGAVLWVFVPSLFTTKEAKPKKAQEANASLEAVPSLASPIHVRRRAWLTAIQTVWVPRHNFILEAAALIMKTMKLSLRNTMGTHGYQVLTGLTEEQEMARVKAWSIALDAQLAGGDVEINKSRLTLTLLASGTLPDTPLRLMMKALHIRVLLWETGGNDPLGVLNVMAAKLSRTKWNEARQLNRLTSQLRKSGTVQGLEDELPEHLVQLLEEDCDEVLNDDIVQRAHNLAWNRPTKYNMVADVDGMDAVVDDQAVRSPMDAVAAWWSSLTLQRTIASKLAGGKTAPEKTADDLVVAAKLAPIGSHAQARALVARAVLLDAKRGANIAAALQATGPLDPDRAHPRRNASTMPPLIDVPLYPTSASATMNADMHTALRCAMGLAHLARANPPREALALIDRTALPHDTGLLGCAAAFLLMDRLATHSTAADQCTASLERLGGALRIWFGGAGADECGLEARVRERLVERCIAVTKSVVGMEVDTGYGSMSDCDEEDDDSEGAGC